VVFANLLTRVLLHKLEVPFHIEWTATLVALVGTAVLATATGWIASYRILDYGRWKCCVRSRKAGNRE